MIFVWNDVDYLVDYEIVDLEEHEYNIKLVAEDGDEVYFDQLPPDEQLRLQDEVVADATGSNIDHVTDVYEFLR